VAPARLELHCNSDSLHDDAEKARFLGWASDVLCGYARFANTRVGRVGCVQRSMSLNKKPAMEIAAHFCQSRWLVEDGPINRPENFEIHSHKRFVLPTFGRINSWLKCKSAVMQKKGTEESQPAIVVEQDFNSLNADDENASIDEGFIRAFFSVSPSELRKILDLYFPGGG
jgi:hypothetical protein